ncbi:thymidylate kinase [Morganella phage vB_MmoM_MP1]|uniref:Uncharacterized protein n=1 Tax=Morganella phage vB_MmoM_MP1 TaxID=1852628 RepID=A0A192Y9S5_9CAUD|nr:thymidylate kinase [Morganella phage vB_MmoM_MP1]ANM46484.1 hypothetical protein MP1_gp0031 [Morganella phage vB_MmoM_MP1]
MNILLVEGPDNAGKTSLIERICYEDSRFVKINFPKRTEDGRFTIESRNEVACFETMLKYLDKNKVYVLDRGHLSNIVYGNWRAKTDADLEVIETYRDDFRRLCREHCVRVFGLTRNKIEVDFEDDLITLPKDDFNGIISSFDTEYNRFNIESIQILNHDENNKLVSVNDIDWKKYL